MARRITTLVDRIAKKHDELLYEDLPDLMAMVDKGMYKGDREDELWESMDKLEDFMVSSLTDLNAIVWIFQIEDKHKKTLKRRSRLHKQ